ncbi:MAG: TonB-dependent receptor [Phormidesmis sp.]
MHDKNKNRSWSPWLAAVFWTILIFISNVAKAQDSPLVAMTLSEEIAENEEELDTAAVLLALMTASQTPDEAQAIRKRTPWLARSLAATETEAETETTWLALRTPETEAEKQAALWLALAPSEEDSPGQSPKAPWLARSAPEENDNPNGNPNGNPTQADPNAPSIAFNPAQQEAKRPTDWVSLTPTELTPPNRSNVAINNPAASNPAERYDISDLRQVAITPTPLSETDEVAVSVEANQVEFLSPTAGAFLDIPATSVALRFPVGANIALLVNGQIVDASLVGRTETDSTTQLRTQTWYGITLSAGENILEVISTDTGEVLQSLPLTVRGQPEKLVLLSNRSVPADGRSTATIRGQLVDGIGNISRWDSVVTLSASDGRFLGADLKPDAPGFQVEVTDGEFVVELQSSLEAHLVQIQASANGFEAFGQVQFDTQQRPSLVSGVVDLRLGARGTDFYDSYRDFLPIDGDNRYELDVDAAVFATGNLGEWLYTGAYNSDRTLNENCRGESGLFRATDSDCTNVYPIYGDDSYTDVIAPSLDSLYLRFERNSPSNNSGTDYAMWGDFNTEEFATAAQLFTATNRQLHGFKAHYNFGDLAATALYANNVEGFRRDAIAPDGTSGFYFTSERNIIPGSETVYFELEELERPGSVLERQQLNRGTDYEIDYDRGTLLFNDSVARTAVDQFGQLLVRRIVTTYQHEDGSDTNILAGRLQYGLSEEQGQESWVGTSYFNESQGTRDFSLYGADAQISLGESTQLTAEVARSSSNFETSNFETGGDRVSGSAYRVEVDSAIGDITGRAHFRRAEPGFTNTATTSFIPGQTRYGAQVAGRIGSRTSIRAQYDHEDNFGTAPRILTDLSDIFDGPNIAPAVPLDNSLTTYSVGIEQRFGEVLAAIDWIHRDRSDRTNSLPSVSSDQLRSRLTYPIADNLSLVAQNELNLSSDVDPIYPSRTLIGLDWQAMPWLNVGVNQIFYGGGGNDRGSATSLDVTGEHTFASDTTIRGRFSSIDGRQLGGSIGLEQGIVLAPGLHLDLGYEKVFDTFGNQTAAGTQVSRSIVTGLNAAALGLSGGESYNVGLSYTDSADFQGSTRFEHRRSSSGTNTVFNVSAVGRLSPAFSILGDYRLANTANRNLTGLGSSSLLKLGLAYRDPANDRLNALMRYEHRVNPNALPTTANTGTSTETQEHLLAAEAIYAPNWRWELYGKYALRNSSTDVSTAGSTFSNNSTVQLAQARATYRLGYRWDVVGEARWIGGSGYSETGYALEAGYYPLPDLRLSAGYSGGATDVDFGNNRSAGGFYLGATAKLGGLFGDFGTQPIAPPQAQESVLEVLQNDAAFDSAIDEEITQEEITQEEITQEASTTQNRANEELPADVEL